MKRHVAIDEKYPLSEVRPRGAVGTGKPKARVLIAEDDWAFRDILLFAFEDEGCEVVAVGDGSALIDTLVSSLSPDSPVRAFDLVVSDLRMPKWNGLPTLLALLNRPHVPPLVLITAFGGEEVHEAAHQGGVVAVLDKPFDLLRLTSLGMRVIAQNPAISQAH